MRPKISKQLKLDEFSIMLKKEWLFSNCRTDRKGQQKCLLGYLD